MAHNSFRRHSVPGTSRLRALVVGALPLVVSALIVAAGFEHPAPLSAAQAPASDVRVNQVTTADQHEPALAVNPSNPNIVLSAAKDWRTGPKQVWYYRSSDGGKTWVDG